jgi:TatD DNase family protein
MQNFPFFDSHTHTQFAAYEADREAVILRAKDAGVRFVNVGTQKDTSRRAVEFAERHDGVFAVVGLHPIHTSKSFHDTDELGGDADTKGFISRGEVFDTAYYRELALHSKTLAIGECGLDYFHFNEDESRDVQIQKQKDAFLAQVALAAEVKKPLMIHCREALPDLIAMLHSRSAVLGTENPGIVHFFTGTVAEAQELLDLGFSFTFGGAITFPPRKGKEAGDYDEVVRFIPLDRILSETDAPYVTPVPHRGERNEPAYVVEVVKKLAELKGITVDEMAARILKNAKRIFGV